MLGTIDNGHFPEADQAERVAVFNAAIVRAALAHGLDAIGLRAVCTTPQDDAHATEPSQIGGARIARTIVQAVPGRGVRGMRLPGP